jgi:CheY-like chemotaxis protein
MDGYEVARAFHADEALKDIFLVALPDYALPQDLQRARAPRAGGTLPCRESAHSH